MSMVRTTSAEASAVLERVAGERRQTISLPGDAEWLAEITPSYAKLLDSMEGKQSLYRVLRGNYVVAPRATDGADQAAPVELLVDLVLRDRAPYYLGFLSALIAHGLTDLHSQTTYAAIPQEATTGLTSVDLAGSTLQIVRLSDSVWPQDDDRSVTRRRAVAGTREFVRIATVNRTLVDGLLRPDLCAGIETVFTAWARAQHHESFDPAAVWAIAKSISLAAAKRTALLLNSTGHSSVVEPDLPTLKSKRSRVLLDRNDDYGLAGGAPRDPRTGVTVNVPSGALDGWLGREVG